jgi:hypothetical protein
MPHSCVTSRLKGKMGGKYMKLQLEASQKSNQCDSPVSTAGILLGTNRLQYIGRNSSNWNLKTPINTRLILHSSIWLAPVPIAYSDVAQER